MHSNFIIENKDNEAGKNEQREDDKESEGDYNNAIIKSKITSEPQITKPKANPKNTTKKKRRKKKPGDYFNSNRQNIQN